MSTTDSKALRRKLLAWYRTHGRDLPWRPSRAASGRTAPDPYHVWLSEIMLQQTMVSTVTGYFDHFVARWPNVSALAAADLDEVLHAWQGLGYYARARNLHRCAGVVANNHGGLFPESEDALRQLPGIGAYTAAAVAAIAYGAKTMPVDGNIERVLARLHALNGPLSITKPRIAEHARALIPMRGRGAGDVAQAMMDLGATVCAPRGPRCETCPWRRDCAAFAIGQPEAFPAKNPKPVRPIRHGVVFWLQRDNGAVLLRRRPEKGLLGGMMEFPSTDWRTAVWSREQARDLAPALASWRVVPGQVDHVFSHFALRLTIWRARIDADVTSPAGTWVPVERFDEFALPTLMRKVAKHVQEND